MRLPLLIALAVLSSFAFSATSRQPIPQKIDFEYTDGLFGSYRLVTTPGTVQLRAGPRVISFDIKPCNRKLINVYLARVQSTLKQLRPALREKPQNRVVMNRRVYRIVHSSPAAPILRNLPSETYYLQRLQADLCRKARVPASEELAGPDPRGVMTKLEQINKQLAQKPSSDPTPQCSTCVWDKLLQRKDMNHEVHGCLKAICGGNKSAGLPDLNAILENQAQIGIDSPAAKDFEKTFGPIFESIDKKFKEIAAGSRAKYLKLLAAPPSKISNLDDLRFYEGLADQLNTEFYQDDDGTLYPDSYDGDKPNVMQTELKKTPNFENNYRWWNKSQDINAEFKGPIGKAVQNTARDTLKKMKALQNSRFGKGHGQGDLFPGIQEEFLKDAANGGDLKQDEMEKLLDYKSRVDLMERRISDKSYQAKVLAYGQSVLSNKKMYSEIQREAADLEVPSGPYVASEDYGRQKCRMAYAIKTTRAPTQQQIESARKIEAQVRTNLNTAVFSQLSKQTAGILRKKLSQWQVEYPDTTSEAKARFTKQLRSAAESIGAAQPSPDGIESNTPADELSGFCSGGAKEITPMFDHAITSRGSIQLSTESAMYPNLAMGSMAHEFGHLIAEAIKAGNSSKESREKFIEVRKCLALKHKSEGGSTLLKIGATETPEAPPTDEDYADQIAHLAAPNSPVNIFCMDFGGEDSEFSMYGQESDDHSTNLFRLLFAEHSRQSGLPDSCKKMLKTGGADIDFAPCM